jgi:HK97 family phage prohead protease
VENQARVSKEFSLSGQKSTPLSNEAVGAWVISSDSYDRVSDRILAGTLKAQTGREVICLWQHDSNHPIGKWTNLRMMGNKLVADLILAKTAVGDMCRALLEIGTPLGASVGFTGKGKKNAKGGVDFSEISLLETSVVSVPCNAEAMQVAKSFGVSLTPETPASSTAGFSDEERDAVLKRAVAARENALNSINSKQEYSNEAL